MNVYRMIPTPPRMRVKKSLDNCLDDFANEDPFAPSSSQSSDEPATKPMGSLERLILTMIGTLSFISLIYSPFIEFNPAVVTENHSYWTMLTCNTACCSLLLLFVNVLAIRYVVNQLEAVWSTLTFLVLFSTSALVQSLMYWGTWIMSGLVLPRSWILGSEDMHCGVEQVVFLLLMGLRQ